MSVREWPIELLVGGIVAAAAVAILACVYFLTRTTIERRVRFARFLGKALIFLLGGTLVLGLIAQFIR